MKKILSAAAVLAIASGAQAAIVYATSFENFANGAVAGQFGWDGASNGQVGNTAGIAHTGTKYLRHAGNATAGSWSWATSAGAVSNAALASNPIVKLTGWASIFQGTGTRAQRVQLQGYDSAVALLGSIGFSSDGSVQVTDGTGSFTTAAGVIANVGAWHKLEMTLNYALGTVDWAVDGVSFGSGIFAASDFQDADFYASAGAGTTGTSSNYFDDLTVENIPAPASLALMGMGLIAGGRRRR